MPLKVLGQNPFQKLGDKISQSLHFQNGVFTNIEPTEVTLENGSFFRMIKEFINKPKDTAPLTALPTIKTDLKSLKGDTPEVVWFGHSSFLITTKSKRILVDPVFGNASPVSFFGKPFKGTNVYGADDMPEIDLLIISHDHYDHLDFKTLCKIKSKIKKIVCALGVRSHFIYWGFDESIITELDWDEKCTIDSFEIISIPARHFSGRTFNRNKTLWSAYVLSFDGYKIFIGGDSGYDGQFKKTGDMCGPFDIAFLECGQYGKDWSLIHMFPEQTAQAALDLKAKVLFPVHWAKFTLSLNSWNDSIKRVFVAAKDMPFKTVAPKIGEVYGMGKDFVQEEWWNI
ncbi:MAG: MBL fold metallo-hydrolase [Patescibacteria group bacterium]